MVQVVVKFCIQHERRAGRAKQNSFEAEDLELAFGILGVSQPEKSGKVSIAVIQTKVKECLFNIC